MNYLAHGLRFVDRPYFVAGTAVPDWLSVSDRRVRMRERYVGPHTTTAGPAGEIAAGILQHLADDDWFHVSAAFHRVTSKLGRMVREVVGTDGFRSGFVGHVLGEMLIDTVLARRDPTALQRYYAALEEVDAATVMATVNAISHRGEAVRLAEFVDLFRRSRFLEDYAEPDRLVYRLNQVQKRVRLPELPPDLERVVVEGEAYVASELDELLPGDRMTT